MLGVGKKNDAGVPCARMRRSRSGKESPTAMSVVAFEGDVSCVVEELKRTRCLGFCPLASA
jgi:hypothetical protein